MADVTRILHDVQQGDPSAPTRLFEHVYDELRQLAAAKMSRESSAHTLQPTALVHEAWLRLGGDQQTSWRNRAHFFGAAAEAMRRILVDHARRRQSARRGSGHQHLNVDEIELPAAGMDDDRLLAADDALEILAAVDAGKAELVKLRFFVGLSVDEAAQTLGISEATAHRWWVFARAWLIREINARAGRT
jgi:RNA polymerase sigma factor (TIGR02999 family)